MAGQAHESMALGFALEAVRLPRPGRGRPRTRPARLAGDEGYSHARIRRYLRARRIRPAIPTRKDQKANPDFEKASHKRRNVIERRMVRIKEDRRAGTRHEKLAVNFLAMVNLATIRRRLRILESPDRT